MGYGLYGLQEHSYNNGSSKRVRGAAVAHLPSICSQQCHKAKRSLRTPFAHFYTTFYTVLTRFTRVYSFKGSSSKKEKEKKTIITMHTRLETRGSREVQARSLRKQ